MMIHAWSGYKKYAWGYGALNPVKNIGISGGPFGDGKSMATIVDSLDTLFIMDLKQEYNLAVEYLNSNFEKNFKSIDPHVSVFEITIRYIGGFLSAYQLSNDKRLLNLAKFTADIMVKSIDTGCLPWTLIVPKTLLISNYNWIPGMCTTLADAGTLHLEFKTLSKELL